MSLLLELHDYAERISNKWHELSRPQKLGVAAFATFNLCIAASFIYVGPSVIFAKLADMANNLRDTPGGWLVLVAGLIAASFPPLIGFGTFNLLCGFAYGTLHGTLIAFLGYIIGAAGSFIVCRRILTRFATTILERQPILQGLSKVMQHHGIRLIALVRLCPFPTPYSHAFFASLESVDFKSYMLANILASPRLLLPVWVGSRIYLFADPEHRDEMDSYTKTINGLSIAVGLLLAVGTGFYLYRVTSRYVAAHPHAGIHMSDDVDELERQLLAEGHLDEDAIRASQDGWGDLDISDEEHEVAGKKAKAGGPK